MSTVIQEMAIVLDMLDATDIPNEVKVELIREAITLLAKFIRIEQFKEVLI